MNIEQAKAGMRVRHYLSHNEGKILKIDRQYSRPLLISTNGRTAQWREPYNYEALLFDVSETLNAAADAISKSPIVEAKLPVEILLRLTCESFSRSLGAFSDTPATLAPTPPATTPATPDTVSGRTPPATT